MLLAMVGGAVVLAAPAQAHPPDQHISQQIPQQTAIQDLQALLSVGGLGAVEQRAAAAECNGQGGESGTALVYPCRNVDLESFVVLPTLGGATGNDIWGWTDPKTGNEYAIMGTATSTGFVDVTDPQNPVLLGVLPTAGIPDAPLWRDIKVHANHAFIVSENSDSGMQVFDLTKLRDEDGMPPALFSEDAFYDKVSNTHNIAINEESGFAYLVGSTVGDNPEICETDPDGSGPVESEGGGLHMVDISDPKSPKFAGCANHDGIDPDTQSSNNYVHDVQCVIYDGPDQQYAGREICFGSNENALVIYDVTDKANPKVISETDYDTDAYTHQGWLTEDRKHFLFGDELDEQGGEVANTTTYIAPVSDLDSPGDPKPFAHETNSIDHNMYVHGDRVFQSNYAAGLRILGLEDSQLAAGKMQEKGFFDVVPGADPPEFAGTWSNYRFPASGTTVVSAIENEVNGLFVLKPTGKAQPTGSTASSGSSGGAGSANGGAGGNAGGSDACSNRIEGTNDRDKLNGTKGSDRIVGKRGNDKLRGRGGDDCLLGKGGRDKIRAGGGGDEVRAGGGRDRIKAGGGDDEIRPGRAKDRIKAGGGDDLVRAARGGRDRVNCGAGDDVARVKAGKDRVKRNCERVRSR